MIKVYILIFGMSLFSMGWNIYLLGKRMGYREMREVIAEQSKGTTNLQNQVDICLDSAIKSGKEMDLIRAWRKGTLNQ